MSTEPRRIKRIVRHAPRPLTEVSGTTLAPAVERNRPTQKALTFALQKVRVIEGYVTLPQLAAERGIQAQLARLWIKAAGIKKPRDRWVWAEGSKALGRARKVLGLKP